MFFTPAVGIDICKDQVIVVCLKRTIAGLKLSATDKCLLAPEKNVSEQSGEIADFVNGFLRTHKISAADIYIGVPVDRWIFRQLEFPLVVRENLASTLVYEMEKYVPLAVDEVYFDYQVVSEDKAKETFALALAVARKSDLDIYLKIAEMLSSPVSGVTTGFSGIANSFLRHCGQITNSPSVVAFPGPAGIGVAVLCGKAMTYAKKMPAQTDSDQINEKARQLIGAVKSFQAGNEPLSVAIHAKEVEENITAALAGTEGISFSGLIQPDPDLPDTAGIPAYGLALQAAGDAHVSFNLMPDHLRKKPNRLPSYAMYALAALLFIAAVSWGGIHTARQYARLSELNEQLDALQAEVRKVEQLRSDVDRLEARMGQLNSLRPGNACVVDVLLELTRIMPDTAWIRDLNISGNNVIIYGYADSATDLITMLEESSLFQNAEFLATIRKTGDGQEVFRIGFKFNRQ